MTHEHLKERALFSLPPPPPGANPTEYYHLMASQRSPYGDLLLQTGAAAAAAAAAAGHLPDYISPLDGKKNAKKTRPTGSPGTLCERGKNGFSVCLVTQM